MRIWYICGYNVHLEPIVNLNMEDIFITEIIINEVRNIKDFHIPICEDKKCNLIITGKNGSGKTSLLRELKTTLNGIGIGSLTNYDSYLREIDGLKKAKQEILSHKTLNSIKLQNIEDNIILYEAQLKVWGKLKVVFDSVHLIQKKIQIGNFILAFFEARRDNSLKTPTGINKVNMKPMYGIDERAGKEFIQYIVNLKADRSFAKDDNDVETVSKTDDWFKDFELHLAQLFDNDQIRLQFDRKTYNFNIVEGDKEPYNLNQLSDGYSAILSIVTELIMRMEEHKTKSYDVQGIVLVDEIETHLHIDLQKKVLPFLTAFFPKIQFIVTTHSPFVLSSIENAVICDLEKKIVTSDLSGYSYDTIVESYFHADKYSAILKNKIAIYERLKAKNTLTEEEQDILLEIKMYLNEIPKFISDELAVKIQEIKLKELTKKRK